MARTGIVLHPAEQDRLDSLDSYGVLDSPPEPAYDAVTALAAQVCAAPLAAVTLIGADRQYFKSTHGFHVVEAPRHTSFCADVVAAGTPVVVPDAAHSPRYAALPSVRGAAHVRAYAGVPLTGRDGLPVGTLCVFDRHARPFTAEQLHALTGLADHVVALLEQRRRDRTDGLLADCVLEQARDPLRLRRALDAGELVPHYQPLVELETGHVHGLEALLRWEHPQFGTLPPAAFLPAIEASALVVPVGRAVLDCALAQRRELDRAGLPLPGRVAVNVASGQLARPGLSRDVLAALHRHGLDGAHLALEITEATALPDVDLARSELSVLADAGVQVVIDDFGVGWSNLSRVLQLPVGALKLDRCIAAEVVRDPRAEAMAASTLALAAGLGLDVIAEGVESQAVREHLVRAGCRWAQGWLFSAAVPAQTLPHLLDRRSTDWLGAARPVVRLHA